MAYSELENIGIDLDNGQQAKTKIYISTEIIDTDKNDSLCSNVRIFDKANNQFISLWFDEEQKRELIEALEKT